MPLPRCLRLATENPHYRGEFESFRSCPNLGREVDDELQEPRSLGGMPLALRLNDQLGGAFFPDVTYNNLYVSLEAYMDAITYSSARANLAKTMDRVCEDHEPIIITRNGEQSVVMLSLDDFKALEETAYLLRSPLNAKRLLAAVSQLAEGKGTVRELAK